MLEGKDLFELILDNATELLLCHDESGQILMMNNVARSQLGIPGDAEPSDYNIRTFFSSEKGCLDADLALPTYDGIEHEFLVYRLNKTVFHGKVKGVRFDTNISPYVLYIENLSAFLSLERQIEKVKEDAISAEAVKSEFTSNVTHELRTPLNSILGYTRELIDVETDAHKLDSLNTIERCCNNMNALINSILDFSKLEAGKFTLENREFDFREMIDNVKKTHMPKITEKGLDFIVTVSKEVPERVIGDELRIEQILNNILSNATKFTHTGRITLEVLKTAYRNKRAELTFIIIDTGIGIAKGDMDKLFKSFSQIDASVSRQYGGTGLGLNITKQLAELMGGSVSVDSVLGKGSMFSVSIWVNTQKGESAKDVKLDVFNPDAKKNELAESTAVLEKEFGTNENRSEIIKKTEKLVLCMDMGNWEKAEQFAVSIRDLTVNSPKDFKTAGLKLKMSVQKADEDGALEYIGIIRDLLEGQHD